jgi:hypothetical protein
MSLPLPSGAAVLGLRLLTSSGAGRVEVELSKGERSLGRLELELEELGLGAQDGGGSAADPSGRAQLPDYALEQLTRIGATGVLEGGPLWLRFRRPSGGLGAVPWERWLVPALHVPVLRSPYFALDPAPLGQGLELVLCGSSPEAKVDLPLAQLMSGLLDSAVARGLPGTFHVFADAQAGLEPSTSLVGPRAVQRVEVVPVVTAQGLEPARSSTELDHDAESIENPWLRWMLSRGLHRVDTVGAHWPSPSRRLATETRAGRASWAASSCNVS